MSKPHKGRRTPPKPSIIPTISVDDAEYKSALDELLPPESVLNMRRLVISVKPKSYRDNQRVRRKKIAGKGTEIVLYQSDLKPLPRDGLWKDMLEIYEYNQASYLKKMQGLKWNDPLRNKYISDLRNLENWFCDFVEPQPTDDPEEVKEVDKRESLKVAHRISCYCDLRVRMYLAPESDW